MIALFLMSTLGFAQVKGNKVITSKTFDLETIKSVKIDVYAKVTIDANLDNKITIKADENIINLIDRKVENGTLYLNQLEWIQASQKIEITVGAPNIIEVESGTHDITIIKNINNQSLKLNVPIGKVKVAGVTQQLIINTKSGTVDASDLKAENATVSITGDSKTKLQVTNQLKQVLGEDARLELVNKPKFVVGDKVAKSSKNYTNIKWINIKIKNNSWNRNKLVVVGPKSDGSQFSYGFAMMPGATKNERWTIGSKVYKTTRLGSKKLLATVTAESENQLIKLFQE